MEVGLDKVAVLSAADRPRVETSKACVCRLFPASLLRSVLLVWGGTLRGEGLGTRNGKDGSENVFVANTMRERPGKGPALGRERAVNRAGGQKEIPSVTTEAEGVTGAPRAEAGCIRRNIPVCLCCPTYAAFLSNKLTAFVLEHLG